MKKSTFWHSVKGLCEDINRTTDRTVETRDLPFRCGCDWREASITDGHGDAIAAPFDG